jgi:hypothetical protein
MALSFFVLALIPGCLGRAQRSSKPSGTGSSTGPGGSLMAKGAEPSRRPAHRPGPLMTERAALTDARRNLLRFSQRVRWILPPWWRISWSGDQIRLQAEGFIQARWR